jgi:hypothetical protein
MVAASKRYTYRGEKKKKINLLVMLFAWSIWKEINSRVFEKKFKPTNILLENTKAEAKQWAMASAGRFILG